jgi:type II secretory pathway pseudopilin PulG
MTVQSSTFKVQGVPSLLIWHPSSLVPRFSSRGFTYIALLAAIVIIGILLGATGKYWSAVMQRDREEELLFRGEQYVMAIRKYATAVPGRTQYPVSLDDLLKDGRSATMKRHLRRKFKDPMTGEDFILLRQKGTRFIVGVKSRSDKEPFRKSNFPSRGIPELDAMYKTFEGKAKYSEWKFVFTPQGQVPVTLPSGQMPVPQAPQVPQTIEIVEDAGEQ